MDEHALWVLAWFERRQNLTTGLPQDRLRIDYFQSGLLDSFGTMELIAEVEGQFHITFSAQQFQDHRFSTLGGLAEIIGEMCASRHANAA